MFDPCRYDITVFGDSITKGVGYKKGQFVHMNCSAVEIVEKHYGIKIRNVSSIGQTVKKIYERDLISSLTDDVADGGTRQKCAVFALGGNDGDYDWAKVAASPKAHHEPFTSPERFKSMLDEMTERLISHNVKTVFVSLPPIDAKRYFERIAEIADEKKIKEFFCGDVTRIYRWQEIYNDTVMRCAFEHGCKYIDTRSRFLSVPSLLDYLCEDGIHLNDAGQKILADEVIKQLG